MNKNITVTALITIIYYSVMGQNIKSVKINSQIWMSGNLNTVIFRNGDSIPQAKNKEEWVKASNNKQPAWCYYDYNPTNDYKHGKLYNCYAINDTRGLAPEDWHIPSNREFDTLLNYLGGKYVAGNKMKNKQGCMSLTMEINMEVLIKNLCKNPQDQNLLNALRIATAQKKKSKSDYVTLFSNAYIKQVGPGRLYSLFAGAFRGIDVKINDDDNTVISKIRYFTNGAFNQTYFILKKRIDTFGIAQPNFNIDDNKEKIKVELAGIKKPERIRKIIEAPGNLQFWEVFLIDELENSLKVADKNLKNYLNEIGNNHKSKIIGSNFVKKDITPFLRVINLFNFQTSTEGETNYKSAIGRVALKDTALFFSYINKNVVKNALPTNLKFLLGIEEKNKGEQIYFPLYAVKTINGTLRAPIEGDRVEHAKQDFDKLGNPCIELIMSAYGGRKIWPRFIEKNIGRPIAITMDNIVYSAPIVNEAIKDENPKISGNFTIDDIQDLAMILNNGKVDAPAKIVSEQISTDYENTTSDSSFLAIPSGMIDNFGTFTDLRHSGFWWSSTEDNTDRAWGYYLIYKEGEVGKFNYSRGNGLSVRCLRN